VWTFERPVDGWLPGRAVTLLGPWVKLGLAPGLGLLLALRGVDAIARRRLALEPPAPRPLPERAGRRLLVTVAAGALLLGLLHGALTLGLGAAKRRALAAHGLPATQPPAGDDDAATWYERAVAAQRPAKI
jgi:hypothetical protein